MSNILIALAIGIVAGTVDVIPMLIQKLDKYACISAFVQWIFLGLIIPFVSWDIQPWLKGLIIAELAALPIMIMLFAKQPKSLIPISIFSAILGALVGFLGAMLIG